MNWTKVALRFLYQSSSASANTGNELSGLSFASSLFLFYRPIRSSFEHLDLRPRCFPRSNATELLASSVASLLLFTQLRGSTIGLLHPRTSLDIAQDIPITFPHPFVVQRRRMRHEGRRLEHCPNRHPSR